MASFSRWCTTVTVLMTCTGALLVTGCTSTNGDPVASPSAPASAASTASSPSTAAPPSSATSPSSTATPSASSSPAADAVIINITIADDQVSPNGEKINVTKGQTVVLNVTSDIDDEIHAHTSGDGYELEVPAGKPTTGQFVADGTGSFEVESHHLEKVIAILVVR